jgi:hypothetical protein
MRVCEGFQPGGIGVYACVFSFFTWCVSECAYALHVHLCAHEFVYDLHA